MSSLVGSKRHDYRLGLKTHLNSLRENSHFSFSFTQIDRQTQIEKEISYPQTSFHIRLQSYKHTEARNIVFQHKIKSYTHLQFSHDLTVPLLFLEMKYEIKKTHQWQYSVLKSKMQIFQVGRKQNLSRKIKKKTKHLYENSVKGGTH